MLRARILEILKDKFGECMHYEPKEATEEILKAVLESLPKEYDEETSSADVGRDKIFEMRGFNNAIYKVKKLFEDLDLKGSGE